MNLYKIMILSVLIALPINTATPSEFKSLAEMYGKTPDRLLADILETEYLVQRCAAIYTAIGAVYTNDGRNAVDERSRESAKIGNDLIKMADAYVNISLQVARKTGRTEKSSVDRIKLLSIEYMGIFDRNRELTNDGTSGLIRADLETCRDISKLVKKQ